MTNRHKRTGKNGKKRLALPATWVRNIEVARKNLKTYQQIGTKEVEKVLHKVADHDLVQRVWHHRVFKQATKAGSQLSREVEDRLRQISKEFGTQMKTFRDRFPIPTRGEVEHLSRRVNTLSKKVDEISSRRRSATTN